MPRSKNPQPQQGSNEPEVTPQAPEQEVLKDPVQETPQVEVKTPRALAPIASNQPQRKPIKTEKLPSGVIVETF